MRACRRTGVMEVSRGNKGTEQLFRCRLGWDGRSKCFSIFVRVSAPSCTPYDFSARFSSGGSWCSTSRLIHPPEHGLLFGFTVNLAKKKVIVMATNPCSSVQVHLSLCRSVGR